jgi:hypothetical protein
MTRPITGNGWDAFRLFNKTGIIKMTDQEKIEAAFDLLENAEIIQEFTESIWIKVDRCLWKDLFEESEDVSM